MQLKTRLLSNAASRAEDADGGKKTPHRTVNVFPTRIPFPILCVSASLRFNYRLNRIDTV
jgi:hypothetical protein